MFIATVRRTHSTQALSNRKLHHQAIERKQSSSQIHRNDKIEMHRNGKVLWIFLTTCYIIMIWPCCRYLNKMVMFYFNDSDILHGCCQ